MNKLNILIDGNFIAMSEFAIFSEYGKSKSPLKTETNQIAFIQGLANKLFYAINALPKGGNVIFCLDSNSWRKSIFIEGGGYKHSREDKDGNKPMMDLETKEIFYSLLNEFFEILQDIGIKVSRVKNTEGDDLLFKWAKYFNENNENAIIISADRDLIQTVRGPNEPFTIQWTNKKNANKIYAPRGWKDAWLSESKNTIFDFNIIKDQTIINKLMRDQEITIVEFDPQLFVFKKILIGDSGDNVPSVWSFSTKGKKGQDKIVRVTEKKVTTIIEYLKTQFDLTDANMMSLWDDTTFIAYLSGVILRVSGDIDDANKRLRVTDNLYRNARLVWLTEKSLPVNLVSAMDEHIQASAELPTARDRWSRKKLLEGTRFDTGSGAPAKMDPFAGMNLDNLV